MVMYNFKKYNFNGYDNFNSYVQFEWLCTILMVMYNFNSYVQF